MMASELRAKMTCTLTSKGQASEKWFSGKPIMINRITVSPCHKEFFADVISEDGETRGLDITTAVATPWRGSVTFNENGTVKFTPTKKQPKPETTFPMNFNQCFNVTIPETQAVIRIHAKTQEVGALLDIVETAIRAFNSDFHSCDARVATVGGITEQPWPYHHKPRAPKLSDAISIDRDTDKSHEFITNLCKLVPLPGMLSFLPVLDVEYNEHTKPKIMFTIAVYRVK
jgi:hypothetical protein